MYTLIRALGVRDAEIEMERNKNESLGIVAHQLKAPATAANLVHRYGYSKATLEKSPRTSVDYWTLRLPATSD
jgi:hypothetical protein